jgi:hypothetical protein
MAKALALTPDALNAPQITPKAATPPRAAAVAKARPEAAPKPAQEPTHPLQIRIPRDEARAIKIAAAERDMTLSDFMLACFHAYMKVSKNA